MMYARHYKLNSNMYNHADFKLDLERALLQQAQQATQGSELEKRVEKRRSWEVVATGGPSVQRKRMPSVYQGHSLTRQDTGSLKCIQCGTKAKSLCECGRPICSSVGGVTCWAWHLEGVATGALEEQPLRWKRSKDSTDKASRSGQ
jgi:hypothetical protein